MIRENASRIAIILALAKFHFFLAVFVSTVPVFKSVNFDDFFTVNLKVDGIAFGIYHMRCISALIFIRESFNCPRHLPPATPALSPPAPPRPRLRTHLPKRSTAASRTATDSSCSASRTAPCTSGRPNTPTSRSIAAPMALMALARTLAAAPSYME